MTATSTSNSLAFRQILDNFNTSPPPSNQHHHLPDHLYLEPLQPIHEQPPSLIPRPRPIDRLDRLDRMDRSSDRPPLHQRASSSAGLGTSGNGIGTGGASAHAAGSGTHGHNGHSRTPTGASTSRPKVTRQLSSSSMSASTGAPLKARVNTSSIVSLADVAQPTLRRKTPSTLSMRSESNTPARSQSPLHVSSSRSAVGSAVGSVVSAGNISPDKPTVRVAKVSPSANLTSSASARLQRAASMRSTGSPAGSPSPAGTPGSGTPSGPSTRRNSAQPSRARSPPGPVVPSQLGSAFGSAIASLGAGAPPRRASDDPHARMRRPSIGSVGAAMTGDRPVHVRNASVVSLGGSDKKPPLETRHSAPAPKVPPLESRRSVPTGAAVPAVPVAPPLERGHSGLAEVTPDEVNETTSPTRSPPPRHQRQSSLLSPSTMIPEILPNPPPLETTEEEYGEPSSNRSSPVRPARPLDQTSPHFRPVFASAFPPASCPTSPIPRNLPISPEKIGRRPSKAWMPAPPNHVPTPGSPNMKTVALPTLTPTMSPNEGHRELHPSYRLEENLHQLSLLHSHEAAHAGDPVSPLSGPPLQSPPDITSALHPASPLTSPPVTSSASPGGSEDDIEKAKVNRKIADLEISNSSLLSINKTLEKTKAMQRAEIVKLRRRLREQELPPLRDPEGGSGLGLTHQESDEEDDLGNLTDPEMESRWDRLIDMVTVMRRAGEEAIMAKKSGRAVLPWLDLEGEKTESVAGSTAETVATEVTEATEVDTVTDAGTENDTEATDS